MTNLAERDPLTPKIAQNIAVQTTPNPDAFEGPDDQLRHLGVVDDAEAGLHAARIQIALNKIHWNIKRSDVATGPVETVGDCVDSLLDNAF
jgi:hypothetical protein